MAGGDASTPPPKHMYMVQVSVIIPALDAEDTLPATLDAVLAQDYPGSIEVIVADGSDTPAQAKLIRRSYPEAHIVPNPLGNIANGLNLAIRAATGEIIVRCDAHAILPPGYIRRTVELLERTGAANVGGRQHPVGTTFFERTIALMMTSLLGSGGSRYRVGTTAGPTDTVYLGAWYRKTLISAGGFDARLLRNEDYELNWRLRQRGGTVWFDPQLAAKYRPRSSFSALAYQYFNYGRWKSVVLRQHKTSLRARQVAAPLLVLGLVASAALAVFGEFRLAAALPLVYLTTLVLGSAATGIRRREPSAVLLPLVLATMHLSWGIGFFLPPRLKGCAPRAALSSEASRKHHDLTKATEGNERR